MARRSPALRTSGWPWPAPTVQLAASGSRGRFSIRTRSRRRWRACWVWISRATSPAQEPLSFLCGGDRRAPPKPTLISPSVGVEERSDFEILRWWNASRLHPRSERTFRALAPGLIARPEVHDPDLIPDRAAGMKQQAGRARQREHLCVQVLVGRRVRLESECNHYRHEFPLPNVFSVPSTQPSAEQSEGEPRDPDD